MDGLIIARLMIAAFATIFFSPRPLFADFVIARHIFRLCFPSLRHAEIFARLLRRLLSPCRLRLRLYTHMVLCHIRGTFYVALVGAIARRAFRAPTKDKRAFMVRFDISTPAHCRLRHAYATLV